MWGVIDGRRIVELGSPGALRERLNALVLAGVKTATAALSEDYEAEHEVLEHVGEQLVLVDNVGQPIAVVAVDGVEVQPLAAVPWDFAVAEGEGFRSIEDWQSGHRRFWQTTGAEVSDSTRVVCIRFHVVSRDIKHRCD